MRWGILAALLVATLASQPRPHEHSWREYPGTEYNHFPIPPDYQEKTEWAYARLMYPTMPGVHHDDYAGYPGFAQWWEGGGAAFWTMDYPRSDRHFSAAVRRLTRIHARSVEQPINLDEGDQFDWPWLYAVEVGHWNLTNAQVKAFREYLDRGGFFMCDDFHGDEEWSVFLATMHRVFPDRPIVDIPDGDPIFHTVFDLDQRYQVPGAQYIETHRTYEYGGVDPHWRGIYDQHHRLIVAICHDMDLGDSWEHADNPDYPTRFSDLGVRIGVDYLIYAFTH